MVGNPEGHPSPDGNLLGYLGPEPSKRPCSADNDPETEESLDERENTMANLALVSPELWKELFRDIQDLIIRARRDENDNAAGKPKAQKGTNPKSQGGGKLFPRRIRVLSSCQSSISGLRLTWPQQLQTWSL